MDDVKGRKKGETPPKKGHLIFGLSPQVKVFERDEQRAEREGDKQMEPIIVLILARKHYFHFKGS